ncbi:MAG: DUF5686 and carboxypeptidase regulatory-like domain-containing protein [Chitinophagaceae bacterium]
MKIPALLFPIFVLFYSSVQAGQISGVITDDTGNLLSYASILVKGTAIGTTANDEGRYSLQLDPGRYTLVCQYVGYGRTEKAINVLDEKLVVNFRLSLQQTSMKEVVVRPGGEDPAYEIIRNAIKKRTYYLDQLDRFQCQVYIKGQLKLRGYPKKIFGQKVDFEDGDTSKLKMLYLAESVATYSVEKPDKVKIEVTSTKVSGQSDAFGLSQPQILSFYENNIQIGVNLNPRGFVSPIADNALSYYKYKFLGVFIEEGKEINKIQVIPRKKYEPVFSGYINITEGDWRIHSVQLQLTKESQMEIIDTLRVDQLYFPLTQEVWVIKNQVIYPAVKFFGFDGYGSFVNVYSDFNLNPAFEKKFFNNTILKYIDSSNKRTTMYWDSIRPLPLQVEEITDYKKKDSLERIRKSPRYLDSIDKKRNKVSIAGILLTGQNFSREKRRVTFGVNSVIDALNFNTVEGLVANIKGTYRKRFDSSLISRRNIFISPYIRYGFSNQHLNSGITAGLDFGKKYASSFILSGGKDVYQFNNQSTFTEKSNTLTTLFFEKNLMKVYEAWYAKASYSKGVGDGFVLRSSLEFQDRMPVKNTTDYTFNDVKRREFTPNYPIGLVSQNITRHQALSFSAGLTWQPGAKYIEFPGNKFNVGSKYPTFILDYTRGIASVLGSDVNYDKWRFTMHDDVNLKLSGTFDYRLSFGGFFNTRKVQVPDYQHFNGNQSIFASTYLNSFQLAPFYQNSTTTNFFSTLNAEHHFNGLLTNKVPLLKKLNWHLVAGTNAFFVNSDNNYVEVFVGLENILKLFRIDFIQSFTANHVPYSGITIGMKGALFAR